MRLNILGDDFVNGLRAGGKGKERRSRQYGNEKTENSGELPKRLQPHIYFHELPPNATVSDITSNGRDRTANLLLFGRKSAALS
jgi:hypothetical protein